MAGMIDWSSLLQQAPQSFGGDVGKMLSAQDLQLKLQQKRQSIQADEQLKSILGNPANIDPNTGAPKPNVMPQIGGVNPDAMLKFNEQAQSAYANQLKQKNAMLDGYNKEQDLVTENIRIPAKRAYDEVLEKTHSVEMAKQAGNKVIQEAWPQVAPMLSPETRRKGELNLTYDDQRITSGISGSKFGVDYLEKQRVQKKDQVTQDRARYGEPEKIRGPDNVERMMVYDKDEKVYRSLGAGATQVFEPKDVTKVGTERQGAKYGKVSQIAIDDPENPGETKIVPAQQEEKSGQWVTADANRDPLPTPRRIVSTGGSGRQAEAQGMAMINAGNEASGSLRNLVELPIGATSGWLKGVSTQTPDSMVTAIGRGLAGYVNERDARSLQISWQGIGRSLATLEAAGRATGLVGLQKQAESLQPQKGDSYTNVLRSYAEIRQIVERSLETMKTSPGVSSDQKKLMDKIASEVTKTVPWTVHDVNMLETGGKDSVLEFAQKVKVSAEGKAAPEPKQDAAASAPPASLLKEGVATGFKDGSTWTLENGQPKRVK